MTEEKPPKVNKSLDQLKDELREQENLEVVIISQVEELLKRAEAAKKSYEKENPRKNN